MFNKFVGIFKNEISSLESKFNEKLKIIEKNINKNNDTNGDSPNYSKKDLSKKIENEDILDENKFNFQLKIIGFYKKGWY